VEYPDPHLIQDSEGGVMNALYLPVIEKPECRSAMAMCARFHEKPRWQNMGRTVRPDGGAAQNKGASYLRGEAESRDWASVTGHWTLDIKHLAFLIAQGSMPNVQCSMRNGGGASLVTLAHFSHFRHFFFLNP
jgi:hypothetical protein